MTSKRTVYSQRLLPPALYPKFIDPRRPAPTCTYIPHTKPAFYFVLLFSSFIFLSYRRCEFESLMSESSEEETEAVVGKNASISRAKSGKASADFHLPIPPSDAAIFDSIDEVIPSRSPLHSLRYKFPLKFDQTSGKIVRVSFDR